METMDLRGDLLNLFVAQAMGGVLDVALCAPFDEWGCGIIYQGRIFSPEKDVSLIWAQVMKLRISTTDVGDGRWLITMPAPTDQDSVPFPPTYCENPLSGYCYAIVWGAFGPTVPDTLETTLFGTVNLELFNLEF
ncbi:hypothetical protein F2S72_08845 [Pseudomonas syringae pv. actinidiae]|nr:hypothetical protein [Pseudomonas syringae pv. actinidiae]